MKIVHLAPTGNWAGTEEMVCRLANDLADRHDVAVMMLEGEHITDRQIRSRFDDRVTVFVPTEDSTPGERARAVIDTFGEPDIIHAHLRPGVTHAWPMRDLAPVVGHLHVRYFSSQFWWVDAVVCVSPWQVRDIPRSYPGDVFLVPNSVDEFERAGADEVASFRRLLGASESGTVFGSIGRLSPEKGFDLLIKAFRDGFGDDDRLVIVGDGTERERLDELAADDDRIHLVGYVARARRLLPALDVYVSSSRLDSFGLSVLEAMRVGLPVVSTSARGPLDLLRDQPATVVPSNDEAALRGGMFEAATSGPHVAYDLARYSNVACARELEAAYERVLDPASSPDCLMRPSSGPSLRVPT